MLHDYFHNYFNWQLLAWRCKPLASSASVLEDFCSSKKYGNLWHQQREDFAKIFLAQESSNPHVIRNTLLDIGFAALANH